MFDERDTANADKAARREAADRRRTEQEMRRKEFGGFKIGAEFFGWLVAVAFTVLLIGIVGAIATAVGASLDVTPAQAQEGIGAAGIATGVALFLILVIAYLAGGYVAGRMARFDGARQGVGVWLFGLVATLLVAAIGAIFGTQYDIFQRVNLPTIPVSGDVLTIGGIIALAVILVGTLLAAIAGGKSGQRYHNKIERLHT